MMEQNNILLHTQHIKPLNKSTYYIDATTFSFGRVCSTISNILQGKIFNLNYSKQYGSGDIKVILHNFDNIYFTGKKMQDKKWYRYSGYIGGLKSMKFIDSNLIQRKNLFLKSLWGMMPKCSTSRAKIYNSLFIQPTKFVSLLSPTTLEGVYTLK